MSHRSFEVAVKGATKVKLAPPKSKYVEVILLATQSGEAGVAEIFRTLTHRLRDSTWTVVFKSLIIVHLMIKEGARDVTLSYLAAAPMHRLAINNFNDVQTQGLNIRRYTDYLISRAKAYEKTQQDYVLLLNKGHFKSLSVEKGILRESEILLEQIKACTRCDLTEMDPENEISLTAFRMLTRDLLDLFAVMNEAVMNVLQHYFEMSRPDAERAVKIYRKFCTCTEQVVAFLKSAQLHANAMRLQIPRIKHAPVDLANTLQEYLDDKDFDTNRRQYLAQQDAKRTGKHVSTASFAQASKSSKAVPAPAMAATPVASAGPAPDLIDFFDSIEQRQQPMVHPPTGYQAQAPQPFAQPGQTFMPQQQQQQIAQSGQSFMPQQQTAPPGQSFMPQQQTVAYSSNDQMQFGQQLPFGPMVNEPTSYQAFQAPVQQSYTQVDQYGQVASPQDSIGQTFSPIQPQSTNPFRKSTMQSVSSGSYGDQTPITSPIQPQNTNPFARSTAVPQVPQIPQTYQQAQPMQAQRTGTNPFAASQPPQQAHAAPLQVQQTGSTNPFRQSTFVNQNTGTGWQNVQQPTMGGFEQLPTVPVFPRPGQPQQQHSPWG